VPFLADIFVQSLAVKPFAEVFPAENIHHHFTAGVYAKQLHIPAGSRLITHAHKYDHLSILASGSVLWTAGDAAPAAMRGPCVVQVPAGVTHSLYAITDAVWFCIHATDATDADQVDAAILED
jgi:quercetin dioxygenase-like cupin family protein